MEIDEKFQNSWIDLYRFNITLRDALLKDMAHYNDASVEYLFCSKMISLGNQFITGFEDAVKVIQEF